MTAIRVVLVASEDAGVRELIAHLLELRGHEVRLATDPSEMASRCSREQPAVVVVEAMLPSDRWARAVSALQRDLGARCPPIVMVTGSWFEEEPADLTESVETLVSPNRGDELIALVERYCPRLRPER